MRSRGEWREEGGPASTSTDPPGLGALRPIVPVLSRADVRHAPVRTVPAVEPFPFEGPEAGVHVGDYDQAIGVTDIDAPCPVEHGALTRDALLRTVSRFVRALAG